MNESIEELSIDFDPEGEVEIPHGWNDQALESIAATERDFVVVLEPRPDASNAFRGVLEVKRSGDLKSSVLAHFEVDEFVEVDDDGKAVSEPTFSSFLWFGIVSANVAEIVDADDSSARRWERRVERSEHGYACRERVDVDQQVRGRCKRPRRNFDVVEVDVDERKGFARSDVVHVLFR
mgnify:FL=1